ncbi:MAG: putative zinc-binding peptidase [Gammaproteobacteria bacterium]|nr:putative zinc-binding peptidase [Gammaproteobacteria bacterium]
MPADLQQQAITELQTEGRRPVSVDPVASNANPSGEAPAPTIELRPPTVSRAYQCQCGRPVFLRNSQCLACRTPLGYVVDRFGVVPLSLVDAEVAESADGANGTDVADGVASEPPETFTVFGDEGGRTYYRCANLMTPAACNWMVPAPRQSDDPSFNTDNLLPGLCLSCSVTRTLPDLSVEGNADRWRSLELAKRRLLSQLLVLGLPIVTRQSDPARGLAFDFLSNMPGGPHVMTGHETGLITLNAEEADDAVRERIRAEMREPYRTLVGHFRHEIGHYYWDILVQPTPWLDSFRELFGDERADYASALRQHYDNGPPPDWASRFVTGYASSHPWEDWAETWAQYLHMADMADTARSFGVDAQNVEIVGDLFELSDLWQPERDKAEDFLEFLNGWVRLTNVLNELSRSMGQPDYYPFVLPHAAVGKLQFIHEVIREQREGGDVEAASGALTQEAAQGDPSPAPSQSASAPGQADPEAT